MNVLVLGSGGREHALVWKLRQSPSVERVYALPGNDGMQGVAFAGQALAMAERIPGDPLDAGAVTAAIERHRIDLTVVGPEAPLAAGIVDEVQTRGLTVFGPSHAAAELESSKIFAKLFMHRHGIATAQSIGCESMREASQAITRFDFPVAIKADGLAAGKGVVIANTAEEGLAACKSMLGGELGAAGKRLLIEEYLEGEEVSVLFVCDGTRAVALPAAQDHKRVFDADTGPNTGGMGAYSTNSLLSPELIAKIREEVAERVLRGMAEEGREFRGVLYCGLMLTVSGPHVLEFNVRFGDPETQAILLRCEGDLARLLHSAAAGRVDDSALRVSSDAAACVVIASGGYPGQYRSGLTIDGLDNAAQLPNVVLFHAGTRREGQRWVTAGGRVLGVAARAASLAGALERCYEATGKIHFDGMHFRRDIGRRELERHGASLGASLRYA